MNRRQLIALFLALCAFAVVVPIQTKLGHLRHREGLAQPTADVIEVTGNVALAAWRAVVADVFWVKADALQHQGKLEHILWFLTAITKLQPNLPEVWDFISWHVAYNLFYEVESREDKWALLDHGLELGLEGVRKNPNSPDLLHSLGYRFYHKFDEHYFPDAPYFRKKFREKFHQDNFRIAIDLIHRSVALERNEVRSRFACHIYDRWVDCEYMEGQPEKSLKLAEEGLQCWDSVFKEFDIHGQAASLGLDLNKKFLDEAHIRGTAIDRAVRAAAAEKAGDLNTALSLWQESHKFWDHLVQKGGKSSYDEGPRNQAADKIAQIKKKLGKK